MSFEETELRLGLPGNNNNNNSINDDGRSSKMTNVIRKRGFNEEEDHQTMLTMPDLKLNLISSQPPPPKEQVVGWPPISCSRKKRLGVQKGSKEEESDEDGENVMKKKIRFVKVSLDGAPYLRKVDLSMYNSYNQLSHALAKFFGAFTIGKCGSEAGGMQELMNEWKVNVDCCSDYVPTYQDKDGDWMLLGDVPWQMFVESCKRVRIMKGKEAIDLAPRDVEKCKNNNT